MTAKTKIMITQQQRVIYVVRDQPHEGACSQPLKQKQDIGYKGRTDNSTDK